MIVIQYARGLNSGHETLVQFSDASGNDAFGGPPGNTPFARASRSA
jgi:hypothetical protein